MPSPIRLVLASFGASLLCGIAAATAASERSVDGETGNWKRLQAMPRAERRVLWEKLQEFDTLSPAEQSAVRALNARIAQLAPAEQANYQAVLQRYHQWAQGLSDQQRDELSATPPSARMAVVTKLRAQERTSVSARAVPLFLQVVDFAPTSPFETAHRIKAWLEQSPEVRTEIEAMDSPAEQQKRLAELAQHVKLPTRKALTKGEEEALLPKIEANPQLKNWLGSSLRKADTPKQDKARRRVAINYYFLENPPPAVEPSHLMRFEAALPPWHRGQFDHLPPEESRRRLTILYRLVFPAPSEMPLSTKAATPTAPAQAPGAPPAKPPTPAAGTSPF
jgi:hypothetical protein